MNINFRSIHSQNSSLLLRLGKNKLIMKTTLISSLDDEDDGHYIINRISKEDVQILCNAIPLHLCCL